MAGLRKRIGKRISEGLSRRRIRKLAKKGKVTAGFGRTKGSKVSPKVYDKKQSRQAKEMAATGKVSRGAVGAEATKGGTYAKYGKKTKAAGEFRSAFKAGCAKGAKSFSWQGRSYSCAKK